MKFRTFFILALAASSAACNRPDLSTPELAANAFVLAVNKGSFDAVEAIVGKDAISEAVAQCQKRNSDPAPTRPPTDGWQALSLPFYEVEKALHEQNCDEIPSTLKDFVVRASKGTGIRLIGVDAPETKDGVTSASAKLVGPDWTGNKHKASELRLVKSDKGAWVPVDGEMGVKVGNVLFALPSVYRFAAEQRLDEAFKK